MTNNVSLELHSTHLYLVHSSWSQYARGINSAPARVRRTLARTLHRSVLGEGRGWGPGLHPIPYIVLVGGARRCVRATGDHVLWESSGWMHAVQLEQQMVSLVQHAASAFARPTRSTAEVLLRAAQRFVHFASLWAQADVKRAPDWSLSSGRVSMHLPLHRATAVLVTALAQCDRELGAQTTTSPVVPHVNAGPMHTISHIEWCCYVIEDMCMR